MTHPDGNKVRQISEARVALEAFEKVQKEQMEAVLATRRSIHGLKDHLRLLESEVLEASVIRYKNQGSLNVSGGKVTFTGNVVVDCTQEQLDAARARLRNPVPEELLAAWLRAINKIDQANS